MKSVPVSRFGRLVFAAVVCLPLATGGCGQWFRSNDDATTDSIPDSLAIDTTDVDSAAALSVDSLTSDTGRATTAAPGASPTPDTTEVTTDDLLARIDSLTAQVSRLVGDAEGGPEEVADFFANIGWNLIMSVLALVIAYYVIRVLVWVLANRAERSATRRLTYMKAIPVVRIVVWSIAIYYIIRVVFDVGGQQLIVAGGAIGVAVGFASQDALKNVFGGIMIILDQPFQVGDKVRIEGTYGEVVSIGLRSTRIVTPDDNLVSVPNTQVVNGQVANANAGALDCQVVTEIYLPGWVDVVRAKKIAYDAAATSRYVYLEKPIVVLVQDMFDHGFLTRIVVKAYVLDTRYEQVFSSDITERAKSEYLKQGMLNANLYIAGAFPRPRTEGDASEATES